MFAPLPSLRSGISPPCFGTSIGKTRTGVAAGMIGVSRVRTAEGAGELPVTVPPMPGEPEELASKTGSVGCAPVEPSFGAVTVGAPKIRLYSS